MKKSITSTLCLGSGQMLNISTNNLRYLQRLAYSSSIIDPFLECIPIEQEFASNLKGSGNRPFGMHLVQRVLGVSRYFTRLINRYPFWIEWTLLIISFQSLLNRIFNDFPQYSF